MKRWLIACLVIALMGVTLLGLAQRSSQAISQTTFDETLAYEISDAQDVVVSVPGNVERLSVTSLAIVARPAKYDPLAASAYALRVTASDAQGKRVFQREYFQASRVSAPELDGRGETEFVARLAGSRDWVTDPRTTDVDLDDFHGRGGRVRLTAAGPSKSHLLVRIAFSESRGNVQQGVLARSLDAPKRRVIVEGRASLGFGDLPLAAQERALASWGRRIGALGGKDVDYVERRLLLGKFRPEAQANPAPDLGMDIDAQHSAALNLDGPLTLNLVSDRDAEIELREGAEAGRTAHVNRGSGTAVELTGSSPRTIEVRASTAVHLRFQLNERDRARQIGDFSFQAARDGKVEIGPDVRRQRYFRMDPAVPIVLHLAPGQDTVGLTLRGLCQPNDIERHGHVVARWRQRGQLRSAETEVTLTRSRFDGFPGVGDASDAVWLQFHPPIGASDVEFTGPTDLAVSLWTREPMTTENVIHPAYAHALGENEVFRNAPYDVRTWATLVPDNSEPLALSGRELAAAVQVRIENPTLGAAGRVLPERALLPSGTPLRRELLMPAQLGRGVPLPTATWTPVRGATALRIEAQGPEAARLSLRYRLGSQPLGATLSLVVDGSQVYEQPLLLESGTLERPLEPGLHVVSLGGLLPDSEVYARAAPAMGGSVVKSYNVFELSPLGHMDFQVEQRAGETLKLILFVVTEGAKAPFQLSYAVDGGHPVKRLGSFFRKSTEASGMLEGVSGAAGSGHLWEAAPSRDHLENPDGVGRAQVRLGDDLGAGRHSVRITNSRADGGRSFLRAVVVGQAPAPNAGEFGLWSAEPF